MTYALNWFYRYRYVPWGVMFCIAFLWFFPEVYDTTRAWLLQLARTLA